MTRLAPLLLAFTTLLTAGCGSESTSNTDGELPTLSISAPATDATPEPQSADEVDEVVDLEWADTPVEAPGRPAKPDDNDPWWESWESKGLSEEAREIEANLGITSEPVTEFDVELEPEPQPEIKEIPDE